ncbi:MAG: pirin family protein [Alphaproteobacteria bacterium]|nr:pirin family protein [Alphaproteobacteria bacterium]
MSDPVELVLGGKTHDIGAFMVRRTLPQAKRRHLGPFVFFDEVGPATLKQGEGMDVRPHPHIGLSTVTYLFDGEILHRDSLGFVQAIKPGALNWMTAGKGIVHSERTDPALRGGGLKIHGIQTWVALPPDLEECEPSFSHHPAETLPETKIGGVALKLILGSAYGLVSPVPSAWPIFYVHAEFAAGTALTMTDEHQERGFYVVSGKLDVAGKSYGPGELVVLRDGETNVTLRASEQTRAMLLGGKALPGARTIWWNFVSSDKDRLERAKAAWKAGEFPKVPGETEFIPLPD